ncbi:MAG: hypothetical protein WCI85_13360 [Comamonadaceae bacterium]
MILVTYRLLCVFIAAIIVWNMFKSDKSQEKIVYCFLIIPLLLRVFLVK